MRACYLLTIPRGDGVRGVLRGTPSARRAACLACLPSRRAGDCRSPTLRGSGVGFCRERFGFPSPLSSFRGLRAREVPRYCAARTWHRGCERAGALSQGFAGGGWLLIAVCAEDESASSGREPGHYLLIGAGESGSGRASRRPRVVSSLPVCCIIQMSNS